MLFPRPISRTVCSALLPVSLNGFTGAVRCGTPLATASLRGSLDGLLQRLAAVQENIVGTSVLVGIAYHPCTAPRTGGVASTSTSQEFAFVQDVIHTEPPARRDERLLTMQADEEWALLVERRIHGTLAPPSESTTCPGTSTEDMTDDAPEKIHLLRFGSGDGALFRNQLLEGSEFRSVREAMEASGYNCIHPSQAIVLVKPDQFSETSIALKGHELHPFHVIITESFEYLLDEVLAGIPCRRRPREKARSRRELLQAPQLQVGREDVVVLSSQNLDDPATGAATPTALDMDVCSPCSPCSPVDAVEDREVDFIFCERRTFLCFAPRLRDMASVVQSTTEAVKPHREDPLALLFEDLTTYLDHPRGLNPRRLVLD
eukprot:CAMPEP_0206477836 /NCGR_PEP_ID=MMETSP0324_2-20121206/35671_1 /ASSEMBLY_ACC=CAM_ASM_000836 /TAXON_ID=2866 /ORGANISM="Crypthecodinium cohnii, Strain Seligo" /LENGTH=374 /DNA_ID=CAMNT_0053953979 /DNA_START=435 /DNA_END=1559 /DNA_ORIENTATION=+